MKFGRLAISNALNAVLAHDLSVGSGLIRKGTVLRPEHLERLQQAGYRDVVAAQPEVTEQNENAAALAVATGLAGVGVTVSPPVHGRCNLRAQVAGLACLAESAITAIHELSEDLAIATVPAFCPVRPGELIASIKCVPFAVSDELLRRCLTLCPQGAVSVSGFRPRAIAGLATYEASGRGLASAGDPWKAVRARLNALGNELGNTAWSPHSEGPLAEQLARLAEEEYDLILVAPHSAIVDRRDVVPGALVRAGGVIERFGMPVDPGNLLLVGRLGSSAVIGLPGCAREPARGGADLVLERFMAGLPIASRDLAQLWKGGLMKSARRYGLGQGHVEDSMNDKVSAVVLAAGRSARMGSRNKLLLPIDGTPMIRRVVDAISSTPVSEIVVVTGHDALAVEAAARGPLTRFVHNAQYSTGLASSLRCGIRALRKESGAALVCLGDMPWVRSDEIVRVLERHRATGRVCAPVYDGQRGHPVIWPARFFPCLEVLGGDVGARDVLNALAELELVPVADSGVLQDIDTPQCLERLRGAEA